MQHPSPARRRGLFVGAATVLVLLLPGLVAAHAALQTASPADTEVVQGTPAEISGTYSEAMKVDGSSLVLQDAGSGKELARGGVDPTNDKRMVIAPVPELVSGDYIVKSTTVSAVDNDIDRKQWIFTVVAAASPSPSSTPVPTASPSPSAAPSATPAATASAAPTTSPAATPAPSPSGSGSDASSGSDVLLPILVVLGLLAVLGVYLFTRRGASTTTKP